MPVNADKKKKTAHPEKDAQEKKKPLIDPPLAFRMGLISLARFGVLDDFLQWLKS